MKDMRACGMFLVFGLRRVWVREKVEKKVVGGDGCVFEDCERGLLKGVLVGGGKAVFVCMCMYVCIDV